MPQSSSAPAQFRCIVCEKFISRNDVLWTHKAEQFDGATCICENCLPEWQTKINPPNLEHVEDKEKKESFIAHYFKHAHENKLRHQREKNVDKELDAFADFIHTSLNDPPLRAILLAIADLPRIQRESLLNTMISQLELKEAPDELLAVMHDLKKDDVAVRVIDLLTE